MATADQTATAGGEEWSVGGGLPVPVTPLVGRDREVGAVAALLATPGVRLVTLTGPGGVGKTRVALGVAAELAPRLAHGAAFVPLATTADPAEVPAAIARALGIRVGGDEEPLARLKAALRGRDALLTLDNAEQVAAAGPAVAELLAACPNLRALVTSRTPLRVAGEREVPVLPLAVEELRAGNWALEDDAAGATSSLVPSSQPLAPAVELFAQRAAAVRPDFVLTPATAPSVAEICARLDGLPLAIELAAAWTRVLSPQALLARLSHRLDLLAGGPRDRPDRQRTMRGAIAWSHDLLSPEERTLFRRLAVFVGGFGLDLVDGMLDAGCWMLGADDRARAPSIQHPTSDILGLVSALVDKSLLREVGGGEEPRFGMLATVREYAAERLAESGEEADVRRAHAHALLDLAERAAPALVGPDEEPWFDRLEAEHGNLQAALAWAFGGGDPVGDPTVGLRIVAAVWYYWGIRGHYRDGDAWCRRALAHLEEHVVAGDIAGRVGLAAGVLAWARGDNGRADAVLAAAERAAEAAGDPAGLGRAAVVRAGVLPRLGRPAEAAAEADRAVVALRAKGNRPWLALALSNRAGIAIRAGDTARAEELLAEGLAICRAIGFGGGAAPILRNLGEMARERAELARAAAFYREALPLWAAQGDRWGAADTLTDLAAVAAAAGQPEHAARLLGAAEARYEAMGMDPAEETRSFAELAGTLGDPGRAELGVDRWDALRAEGRRLTTTEIGEVAAVVAVGAPVPAAAAGPRTGWVGVPGAAGPLTVRELEVLAELAAGRTTDEAARVLGVAPRTVSAHVANVLRKLEVDTRAKAVARAIGLGLLRAG